MYFFVPFGKKSDYLWFFKKNYDINQAIGKKTAGIQKC